MNANERKYYDNNDASDDDDFFGDDDEYQHDLKMRDRHFTNMRSQFATAGYREGAAAAVDEHRQRGFEEGMVRGIREGIMFGNLKGCEHAYKCINLIMNKNNNATTDQPSLQKETTITLKENDMKDLKTFLEELKSGNLQQQENTELKKKINLLVKNNEVPQELLTKLL